MYPFPRSYPARQPALRTVSMCSQFADSHSPADLLGDDDTSEVVDTADDSGCFHMVTSKATPHKDHILYASCLHLFRYIAQFVLARRGLPPVGEVSTQVDRGASLAQKTQY